MKVPKIYFEEKWGLEMTFHGKIAHSENKTTFEDLLPNQMTSFMNNCEE